MGAPGMIIEKRAGNLAQKLDNAGLGDRPIVFITHSMGGLVVKALLVGSQVQADRGRKRVAGSTRGIVFCATPHRGSDFATAATRLGIFLGGAQEHLQEMQSGSEQLDILHDQFVEWQRTHAVPVRSYAENIGLFRKNFFFRIVPIGLVVPRDSANPNIAGHTVFDVDEDHFSIVKPKNGKSDVYAGVLRFVRDCIEVQKPALNARAKLPEKIALPTAVAGDLLAILASLGYAQKVMIKYVIDAQGGISIIELAELMEISRRAILIKLKTLHQGLLVTDSRSKGVVQLGRELLLLQQSSPEDVAHALDS
ncbi:hypothetical protein PS928_06641 [Pseudomonas fluorescens]|uniref:DUF676 domain-containing protein n=2 Tax=Pseudomonas fluorescens TaxID=294 RepID=A0A5E7VU92_PSEFL|nr:hypothetical protein PS928_06641 [Pseudomonas fluorescens]